MPPASSSVLLERLPGTGRASAGGKRVTSFLEGHIHQSKGRWAGERLRLQPWERRYVHELFRTTPGGHRIYRESLLGIPRKNGKSTIGSGLGLYMLVGDDEDGPEVYAAAGSKDQARIVFDEAKAMVEASPALRDRLVVRRSHIEFPERNGIFRVLAADAPRVYGINPSGVVIDELWAHRNPELYYALTTGSLAREQPLVCSITTAGFDRESIGYEVFERGLGGLEPDLLFYWIGAREDADWTDRALWRLVNPASWVSIDDLEREFRRLPPAVFARLHLNVWTSAAELWLPIGAWAACKGHAKPIAGEPIWVGVDIGLRRDRSAVAFIAKRGEGDEQRYIVRSRIFEPAEAGGQLDLGPVIRYLKELGDTYSVQSVAYDPHFFQHAAADLGEQLPMVEFPMSNERVVPASQLLYDLIVDRVMEHDGDRTLSEHVHNASVRDTERGWRISKARSRAPIDGLVATMMATAEAGEGAQEDGPDILFVG